MFKRSCEFNITGNMLSKPRYALESMSVLPEFTFNPIALDQDIVRFRYRPRYIVQYVPILNQGLWRLFFRASDSGRLNKGSTEMRYLAGRLQPAHQWVNREDTRYSAKTAAVAKAKTSDLSLIRGFNPSMDSSRIGE